MDIETEKHKRALNEARGVLDKLGINYNDLRIKDNNLIINLEKSAAKRVSWLKRVRGFEVELRS